MALVLGAVTASTWVLQLICLGIDNLTVSWSPYRISSNSILHYDYSFTAFIYALLNPSTAQSIFSIAVALPLIYNSTSVTARAHKYNGFYFWSTYNHYWYHPTICVCKDYTSSNSIRACYATRTISNRLSFLKTKSYWA